MEFETKYEKGMTYQEWKLTEEGQYYLNQNGGAKTHHAKYHLKLRGLIDKLERITDQGYSLGELSTHLDSIGYNSSANQIDHKIPISWFIESSPQSIVNSLDNIQCLSLTENKSKKNNFCTPVTKEFFHKVLPFIREEYKEKISIL